MAAPSGLKATLLIHSELLRKVRTSDPSAISHMRTSPVSVPAANMLPSGLHAVDKISPNVSVKKGWTKLASSKLTPHSGAPCRYACRKVWREKSYAESSYSDWINKLRMFPAA